MEQIKDFCKEKYPFIIVFIWAFVASFIGNIFVLFATEVVLFAFVLICGAKLSFDIGDVLLGLGMFFFYFFDGRSFVMSVVLAGEVLIVYQIGKAMVSEKYKKERLLGYIAVVIGFVFFLYGCLVFANHFLDFNFEIVKWNRVPRTHHEFWFVISSALLPSFIWFKEIKISIRIAGLLAGIVGIINTLFAKGRQDTIIVLVSFALLIILIGIKGIELKKLVTICRSFLSMFVVVCVLVRSNTIYLHRLYMASYWSRDGGIFKNVRLDMWKEGLRLIFNYPFGGNHVEDVTGYWWTFYYAHNTWIDIGVVSGIIPFLLTTLFSIYISCVLIRIVKGEIVYDKWLVVAAYIGIFLYNMVEPAIIANRVFWFTLVLLSGIIIGINKCSKERIN